VTVVANSSALISLSAIGQLDILRKKYKEVLIPKAVWEEVVVEEEGQLGAQEIKASNWIIETWLEGSVTRPTR
jgi:predicted nucleic acid-binding protein